MESTWKIFTLEEVAKHRDERSAWIVLGKNVYDVTNYVAEVRPVTDTLLTSWVQQVVLFVLQHPGGDQKLLENCGTDATLMFNDIGHSDYAKEKLNEFKIGELEKVKKDNWLKNARKPLWMS